MDFNGFQWQVWFDIGCEGIEVARLHVRKCAPWHCSKNVKTHFILFHLISWYSCTLVFLIIIKVMSQLLRQSVLQLAFFSDFQGLVRSGRRTLRPQAGQKRLGTMPVTNLGHVAVATWRRCQVPPRKTGTMRKATMRPRWRDLWNFREFPHPPDFSKHIESMTKWRHYPVWNYITSKWAKAISSCLGHLQTRYVTPNWTSDYTCCTATEKAWREWMLLDASEFMMTSMDQS